MSHADDQKLSELFSKLDKNGDGNLSAQEIFEGYDCIGIPPPPPVMDLVKKYSHNGDSIRSEEFLKATNNWNKVLQINELEDAFKMYEKGSESKLSLDELKQAIPGIENSDWSNTLSEADLNGDGMVSLEELKEYIVLKLS
jgi:calcium-dependent protein kinase